jgi:hypothetical protein
MTPEELNKLVTEQEQRQKEYIDTLTKVKGDLYASVVGYVTFKLLLERFRAIKNPKEATPVDILAHDTLVKKCDIFLNDILCKVSNSSKDIEVDITRFMELQFLSRKKT